MATKKAKEKPPPFATDPDDERDSAMTGDSDDAKESNQTFQVSHLLAERCKKGRMEYLVLWEGYPEEEATWEPSEHFQDPEGILEQWSQRKERVQKGFDEAFDVSAWDRRRKAYKKAKKLRKEKRDRERLHRRDEKAGSTVSHRGGKKRKSLVLDGDDDYVDESASSPQRRRLDNNWSNEDAGSPSSRVSEGSPVNGLKSAHAKKSVGETPPASLRRKSSTKAALHATNNTPKTGSSGLSKPSTSPQKPAQAEALKETGSGASTVPKPETANATDSASTGEDNLRLGCATASPALESNPANDTTRQSPIASASKSTVTATNRPKDNMPDVMADLDAQPTPRKRKTEEGKLYNISQRHRAEMKGRDEAEPNINELTLTELTTGKVVSQPDPKPAPPREPPRGPRAATQPNNLDGLIPLTCPYFDRNYSCEWHPCPFLHRLSDKVASYELYEQYVKQQMGREIKPKFDDPPAMCPWWFKHKQNPTVDGCFRSTEDCWYAHWVVDGGAARLTAQHKTICPYWRKGDCVHGDKCWFVHGEVNQTAPAAESDHQTVPTTIFSNQEVAAAESKESVAMEDWVPTGVIQERSPSVDVPRKADPFHGNDTLQPKRLGLKGKTCPYWYQGECRFTGEECKYAHELLEGGIDWIPTRRESCRYWLLGKCKWSADKCLYAHEHLGGAGPYSNNRRGSVDETFPAELASRPPLSRTLSEPSRKDVRPAPPPRWPVDSYRPTYRDENVLKSESPSRSIASEYPLRPDRPFIPSGPRADRWRPTKDTTNIHPDRLGNLTPPVTLAADPTAKDASLTLSLPDNIDDLEFDITGCEQQLKDILTTAPSRLNVQGLLPLWIRKEMVNSGCGLTFAKLTSSHLIVSDMLSNFLVTTENAALVEVKHAVLLIYFTEETLVTSSSGYMFHLAAIISKQPIGQGETIFSKLIEKVLHINADQFFIWRAWSANSTPLPPPPKKAVCLFFNESDEVERSMWAIYFKNIGADVFSYSMKGAWNHFCLNERGSIIVHPNFTNFNLVPNLGKQLMAKRTVYQLGFDRREHGPDAPFEARILFPYGTTVLITDEIYEQNPAAALQILNHIIKANQGKPHMVWTWKLAGRRGIKRWLNDLALAHVSEHHADDHMRFHLYFALEEIFAPEFEDEDDPQHPVDDAPLITMPEIMMKDYGEKWQRGGKDKEECLDTIVTWFALEALINRWGCRRNVVVHQGTVPDKWLKKNQHVVFYTPEKYLSTFGAGGERRVSVV